MSPPLSERSSERLSDRVVPRKRASHTLRSRLVHLPENTMTSTSVAERDSHITDHERSEIERANKTGLQPVVFVHGLWLLPSSWDRWAKLFEGAGYSAVRPGWPDDPDSVAEAKAQ